MDIFICRNCDRTFAREEIEAATQIRRNLSGLLIKLSDGSYHDIKRINSSMHARWHTAYGIKNHPDCRFCQLEQQKEETEKVEPMEHVDDKTEPEVLQDVETSEPVDKESDDIGSSQVVADGNENKSEPKPEFGSLAFAFNRSR